MKSAFDYSVIQNIQTMKMAKGEMNKETESILKDTTLMDELEKAEFDFAVTDMASYQFIIPYRLGVPFAVFGIHCPVWNMRIPDNPSYVPTVLSPFTDTMTFTQRLINTVFHVGFMFFNSGGHEEVGKYAPDKPVVGYGDILANISLCLTLRQAMVDYPKANPPNVIPIGSMMARSGTPLPHHYQHFMDDAPHGVIYLSFGSQPMAFPPEFTEKLREVLCQVKQKVIWREPHVDKGSVCDNVMVVDWAPQVSILAHPACRVFITHGGMNSLLEAAYHGVPLIAFPFALDQNFNAVLISGKGYGLRMNIATFTPEELLNAIDTILQGGFKEKMAAVSETFRNMPPGGDTAVYWIEHVIKYGANHLRPRAVDMPLYQYLMADVIATITLVWVCVLYVTWKCCSGLCHKWCGRKDKVKHE